MGADPILRDFLRISATRPDAVLVSASDRCFRVEHLERVSEALAATLRAGSAEPGRPVAVRVPNGPAFLIATLACRRAGRPVLLVDRHVPPAEEGRIAEAMGAATAIRTAEPWPDSTASFDVASLSFSEVSLPAGTEWIKVTSGSSGEPTGVAFTSEALAADDDALFGCMGLSTRDRFLAAIPWSHSYGLCSLAVPCLRRGVTLVLPSERGPWAPLDAAREHDADFFPTVPAFLSGLVALEDPPPWPESLRLVVAAGAPLPPETATRFRERFGKPIHAFYGSSETGGITFDTEGGAAERGTVGLPIPGVRVSLDHDGRVCVSGRALGIRRVPQDDGRLGAEGFRSGDRGRFESSGELRLVGRVDAMINVRGKKVHPEEVERVIAALPGVTEVVVLGMFETSGNCESLRAVVAGDTSTLTYPLVVGWCREHLAPHKVPRSVVFVRAIPRNERGKIDREALRRGSP